MERACSTNGEEEEKEEACVNVVGGKVRREETARLSVGC
jgi:hypothetical protein